MSVRAVTRETCFLLHLLLFQLAALGNNWNVAMLLYTLLFMFATLMAD